MEVESCLCASLRGESFISLCVRRVVCVGVGGNSVSRFVCVGHTFYFSFFKKRFFVFQKRFFVFSKNDFSFLKTIFRFSKNDFSFFFQIMTKSLGNVVNRFAVVTWPMRDVL